MPCCGRKRNGLNVLRSIIGNDQMQIKISFLIKFRIEPNRFIHFFSLPLNSAHKLAFRERAPCRLMGLIDARVNNEIVPFTLLLCCVVLLFCIKFVFFSFFRYLGDVFCFVFHLPQPWQDAARHRGSLERNFKCARAHDRIFNIFVSISFIIIYPRCCCVFSFLIRCCRLLFGARCSCLMCVECVCI